MNFDWFKKKELGLPMWAWALIVAVVVYFGYRWYQGRSSGGSATVSPLRRPIQRERQQTQAG